MIMKSLKVLNIFMFAFIMFAANDLFADTATLERIVAAEQDVVYVGLRLKTYSTPRGSRTSEQIVIHNTSENSYRKVVSVVGEQREINGENRDRNRDNDERRRSREPRWERIRRQFSTNEINLIAKNYELELRHWGEKIAGHETDLLIIKPKFDGRPTKHIYFARKNGVILRVEDLDAAGVLRDMFVYTRINFEPKAVQKKWKEFQTEIKPEPRRTPPNISLKDAVKVLKKNPVQPKFIPNGFQLQRIHKHEFRGNHPIQMKYTDGLVDFDLFQMTGKISGRSERERERPIIKIGDISVNKYQRSPTTAFRWSSDGIHFFLSGPIPAAELQKVVESIILKTEK